MNEPIILNYNNRTCEAYILSEKNNSMLLVIISKNKTTNTKFAIVDTFTKSYIINNSNYAV